MSYANLSSPNRPTETTGWGMRPRLDTATLAGVHQKQGCNDFGPGGVCSICRPVCTCRPSEQIGKPFGWHKAECLCAMASQSVKAA